MRVNYCKKMQNRIPQHAGQLLLNFAESYPTTSGSITAKKNAESYPATSGSITAIASNISS